MAKKILIIEDEQTLVKALIDSFKEDKYKIEIAVDGEDGWQKAQELKPDLILLDLILPKMDGFALLAKIKRNDELKDIPVVILTNLSDVADKCQEMGAVECLVKSNESIDDIRNKIRETLS